MAKLNGKNFSSLYRFRSYAYYHILVACDTTNTAMVLNNSGLSINPETFTPPSFIPTKNPGELEVNEIQGGKYVVVCNGLMNTRFFVESAEWTTTVSFGLPSKDGLSKPTSAAEVGTITISEPMGVGFLNFIASISQSFKQEPGSIIFLLKTIFVGHTDDNNEPEFIYDVRPTLFTLTDTSMTFDVTGTKYQVHLVGTNDGTALQPKIAQVAENVPSMEVKGGMTLEQALTKYVELLNTSYETTLDNLNEVISKNGGTPISSDNKVLIEYKIEIDDPYKNTSYIMGGAKDVINSDTAKAFVMTFGANSTPITAMDKIMEHCPQVQKEYMDGVDIGNGYVYKYKYSIESRIESKHAHFVVKYIVKRRVQLVAKVNYPPEQKGKQETETATVIYDAQNAKNVGSTTKLLGQPDRTKTPQDTLPATKTTDVEPTKQEVPPGVPVLNEERNEISPNNVLVFDYIFSGKNLDIEDFDMKMETALPFLQYLASQHTVSNQAEQLLGPPKINFSKGPTGDMSSQDPNNNPASMTNDPAYPPKVSKANIAENRENSAEHITFRSTLATAAALNNMSITLSIHGIPELICGSVAPNGAKLTTRLDNIPQYAQINIFYPDGNYPYDYELLQFWYDGYYSILNVKNIFDNGEFKQILELLVVSSGADFNHSGDQYTTPDSTPTINKNPIINYSTVKGSGNGKFRSTVERWRPEVEKAAAKYGVNPEVMLAIIQQESNGNPSARGPTNDVGLCQFTPGTAQQYGLTNRLDPIASIDAQGRLLRDLQNRFHGNQSFMIAAYNTGPGGIKNGIISSKGREYLSAVTGQLHSAGISTTSPVVRDTSTAEVSDTLEKKAKEQDITGTANQVIGVRMKKQLRSWNLY